MKPPHLASTVSYQEPILNHIFVNLKEQIFRLTVFSFLRNRYCIVISLLLFFLSNSSKKNLLKVFYVQDETKKDGAFIPFKIPPISLLKSHLGSS